MRYQRFAAAASAPKEPEPSDARVCSTRIIELLCAIALCTQVTGRLGSAHVCSREVNAEIRAVLNVARHCAKGDTLSEPLRVRNSHSSFAPNLLLQYLCVFASAQPEGCASSIDDVASVVLVPLIFSLYLHRIYYFTGLLAVMDL